MISESVFATDFVAPYAKEEQRKYRMYNLGMTNARNGHACADVCKRDRGYYVSGWLAAGGAHSSVQVAYGWDEYKRLVPGVK